MKNGNRGTRWMSMLSACRYARALARKTGEAWEVVPTPDRPRCYTVRRMEPEDSISEFFLVR